MDEFPFEDIEYLLEQAQPIAKETIDTLLTDESADTIASVYDMILHSGYYYDEELDSYMSIYNMEVAS